MDRKSVSVILVKVLWFAISLIIGFFLMFLLTMLPTQGRLSNEVPINPMVFITAAISVFFLSMLYRYRLSRREGLLIAVIIFSYSCIIYFVSNETPSAVYFDYGTLSGLTLISCILAILPFFGEKRPLGFDHLGTKKASILFGSSVMWISPLLSELFIWTRWYMNGIFWEKLSYMVLGAMGTKDVLFEFGFWAFASLAIYYFSMRIFELIAERH